MEVCQTPSKEHTVRFINIVGILSIGAECMAKEARRVREVTGVDEVALSLTLHPEGIPSIRKAEFYTELFRQYRKALEGSGVKAGILLQSLIGHGWPGAPVSPEPWQHTVNIAGETTLRMCPLDPGFREYVRQTVRMLARERPYAFLVDDDIRLINGVHLECFCPRHLTRFNELSGKNFSADELREAVRNARPGDPLLACFEMVRRRSLLEFADLIRGAIDAVDPSIPCGFCTASWESPIAGAFAKRLAGGNRPYLRINNALYLERSAKDFPEKMSYTQMLRKFHEEIPDLLDEADTFPQYRYSKSALSMHAHITGAILNGLNGAKLWLTNTRWHDPETAREYEQILARHRNFYPELARTMREVRLQGPIVPLMPGEGNWHPLKLNSFFYETDWNGSLLGQFGIPARWEKLPVKGVRMLAGEDSIAFFSDDELRELLSGPLLLDGTAARAVAARGFAKELGVTPETREYRFSCEENCLTGEPVTFMNDFISPFLAVNSEKTVMISKLMTTPFRGSPEASFVAPGVTLFKNALGGTVAVFARHLKMSPINHQSPGHRRLLLQVLDRLNGKPLPYVVMELQNIYVLHGKMEDGADFLSVFNLNFDPLNSIHLRVQKRVTEILELTPEGIWKPLEWTQNDVKLEIAKRLIDYEAAILKIRTTEAVVQ